MGSFNLRATFYRDRLLRITKRRPPEQIIYFYSLAWVECGWRRWRKESECRPLWRDSLSMSPLGNVTFTRFEIAQNTLAPSTIVRKYQRQLRWRKPAKGRGKVDRSLLRRKSVKIREQVNMGEWKVERKHVHFVVCLFRPRVCVGWEHFGEQCWGIFTRCDLIYLDL